MSVGLIWAQTSGGVIGADNAIPWRLPEDMAHFKATTLGRPVVMGRKTWDSLPPRFRPLSGRRNIVVTRDPRWAAEGAERVGSVAEALELAGRPTKAGAVTPPAAAPVEPAAPAAVWVIGGGQIYRAALEHATTLSVTEVDATVDGDTYAPTLDAGWQVTEDSGWLTSTSGLRYRIRTYTR
ncbi:dihydrofolate reductase [Streptomyces silvensis]|uniref:Dihydrofolate reductase n=1 Tax=Streptomyces silvensis TaxID=1765722 RepID=A0A0W7WX79_9ACTN|nr:dihydrofolate reductase [Streptomyces silvensis]KUF15140.1 dihydrofolate reductase [Streptomyces silvensis]